MSNAIPYGRQHITDSDVEAVVEALQSDFLTQGPYIKQFEDAFATYVGAEYAVAVSNGTAALHLSVMALGIEPDDYVICTPITFAASANCVRYCGGNVLFADIDPETYLLDIHSVRKVIQANSDKKIKGIIPVDFAGRVCDLEAFRELADEYNLWMIEDACHAPGGFFLDKNGNKQLAGNGQFADTSVFSFHPVKHIATAEGGMITTNDEAIYKQLMTLRTHGITRDADLFSNSISVAEGVESSDSDSYPAWYMEMQELGYNYRLTDIQAALGVSQLSRADQGLERRIEIASKYTEAFRNMKGIHGFSGLHVGHAYHLFVLEVDNRRGLYEYLREQQIFAQIHYIPVHWMPYYQEQGWKQGDFPNAEAYYSRCISIPMFPTLSERDQDKVTRLIKNYYKKSN